MDLAEDLVDVLARGLERVLLLRVLEERVEVRDAMFLRVSAGGDRTGLRNAR